MRPAEWRETRPTKWREKANSLQASGRGVTLLWRPVKALHVGRVRVILTGRGPRAAQHRTHAAAARGDHRDQVYKEI